VAVALAALVVLGAVVALVALRDPSDPVAVDDAVARYRTRQGGETPPGDGGDVIGTGRLAPPGVYVYTTSGSDGTDALDGSEHEYPARTTVTVTTVEEGCLSLRWDALEQRWDEEVLCPESDGGLSLASGTVYHSFFSQDERREYECDGAVHVPAAGEPGAELEWTCDSPGSLRSGESHVDGRGEVVGVETVTVAGVDRPALRVRYETAISGETTGEATIERWYALDRPPLVLREVKHEETSSSTVIGTVNSHEDYEIELEAWEPRR
jgi:hypothetical protein